MEVLVDSEVFVGKIQLSFLLVLALFTEDVDHRLPLGCTVFGSGPVGPTVGKVVLSIVIEDLLGAGSLVGGQRRMAWKHGRRNSTFHLAKLQEIISVSFIRFYEWMVVFESTSRLDGTYFFLYFLLRAFGVGFAVCSYQELVFFVVNLYSWTLLYVFDGLAVIGAVCDWSSTWCLMLISVSIGLWYYFLLVLLDQCTDFFEIFRNEVNAILQRV